MIPFSIVRDWQIFGHGSDFPTWSEVGTNCEAKVPNFGGKYLRNSENIYKLEITRL